MNYLLPVYYQNDSANKVKFVKMWEMILKQDTADFELIEILKFSKSDNQYQALFHYNFRKDKSYIIGISDDGNNWYFTQIFSESKKFNQLIDIIPKLDHSFADIIDPKFGTRINYKMGEKIQPFKYTDINGNELSSESLKGNAIVMNFWSITCAPCIKEIPELNKLVEKYKKENIEFIAPASLTSKEVLKDQFLPKQPFLYNITLIDGNEYVISSYPTHVIINQKHEVVDIITGYSEGNIQKLEKTIDEIL